MSEVKRLTQSGIVALKADRIEVGLRALGAALRLAPNDAEIQSLYGLALARAGRNAEAQPMLLCAVESEPDQMGFRLNLSEHYERVGRDAEAAQELRIILSREPQWLHVWPRFIGVLMRARNWRELVAAGEAWLRIEPSEDEALEAVARGKFELGDVAGALHAYHARRENSPSSVDAQCSYALCCLAAGAFDEAASALDEAERLDPDDADMLAAKARLLTYLGRFPEAEAYCRRCLSLDPEHPQAYAFLSQLTKGHLADGEKKILEQLASRSELSFNQRISAAFALARAHDAEGDVDAAFAGYVKANEISLERACADGLAYNAEESEVRTRLIIAHAARSAPKREPFDAPVPIFIVGMPRSGTTLVESVLSAHSQVCGKGELAAMRFILQDWLSTPDANAAQMETWARDYLTAAMPVGGARFFTDKMPMNFEALALIDRLFPKAPIVHVRRNAVETGFSIFRQGLTKFVAFSNRLDDIAHAYGQYARLMRHWRRTLEHRVINIRYEEFVTNVNDAAPKLVRACGLEWEEACRDFQNAPRAISTYSTVQVREPLSLRASAVRFGQHLAPLSAALERYASDIDWEDEM